MTHWLRALMLALIAPLALSGCLFFPGKFESTLTIHSDRSFTYSYKGEVLAVDLDRMRGKMMQGVGGAKSEADKEATADAEAKPDTEAPAEAEAEAETTNTTSRNPFDFTLTPKEQAEQDEAFRKLGAELAKEAGYRTIEYRGKGVFYVDYQISGLLSHGLVFPYNYDNHVLLPWLLVEVRGKDMVRVKAPGFARPDWAGLGGMGGMGGIGSFAMPGAENAFTGMDGTFTLITDGELVAQNNEDGATTAGRTRTVVWKVNSNTPDAPMASIRVKPTP